MRLRDLHSAILIACFSAAAAIGVAAQSTDPSFPTPIATNELSGTIKARDIGDRRLTTYYYVFEGGQGDIFVNVVSRNFSGDIDIFTEAAQRPLTKMVIYPDAEQSETGRLVYLRKPERLVLRIQGRTPGDDPASFQIKFAGSFIALTGEREEKAPTVETTTDTGVDVNSVGTIVAVRPKAKPTPKATPVVEDKPETDVASAKETPKKRPEETEKTTDESPLKEKPVVVVEDYKGESSETARTTKPVTKKPAPERARRKTPVKKTPSTTAAKTPEAPKEKPVDPLAGVRLVVTMKDGTIIEKNLTDLVRFGFDKGVLTIITKDGSIIRHPMTDVAQVNVQ